MSELIPHLLMRRILPFILLISLACSSYGADEKATASQIRQLKSEISSLQKTLSKQQGKASNLSNALKKSELAINRIAKQILALDKQLKRLGSHAGSLEEKRDQLRSELNKRSRHIAKQLRAQYKQGQQSWLQVLLTQRNPEELSRMMRYFGEINSELAAQIKSFSERLDQLNNTEAELSDTEQKIIRKRRELKRDAAELAEKRAERKTALAALRGSIKTDKQRLTGLKADRSRLEALLREVQRSVDKLSLAHDGKSFRSLKGKLRWPVKGPVKRSFGNVLDGVSYDGIWIGSKNGRAVQAAHHGRVVFSDWLRGFGLVLIIDHGSNYLTLYGYNETLQREVGDWVSAGDVVATVGASGGRSASGLYFAIRYKGKATNPRRWLGKR